MSKILQSWTRNGYTLQNARAEQAEAYFANFDPLDPEVARLTGSKPDFTHDEVVPFFLRCVDDPDRYDFLLLAPDGRVVGESVINEIDWDTRSANFRIAIFQPDARGLGLGGWMVETTRDFAFAQLNLHRLSLDVFSFNPRAEHLYAKAGFRREGVLREAIPVPGGYADDILMAILEDEWRALREKSSADTTSVH